MKLILQIAAGVFIGYLAAQAIINAAETYEVKIGMQEAKKEITSTENAYLNSIRIPVTYKAEEKSKKVWIPGQPIQTCMNGKRVLNAAVLKCREGYFVTVPSK